MALSEAEENKQEYKLDHFEGPLDLLLFLIKKNEVNIYDIPISEITEQYLKYINLCTGIDLDNITEFYILASTLLYIKSRMLLPVEVDFGEDFEDPRQELVEKLIDYQKYKKLSEQMIELKEDAGWILERKKKQIDLPFVQETAVWKKVEVWELLKSFSTIMKSIGKERVFTFYEEVSINEKVALINELLETRGEFSFSDLLVNERNAMEVICSFFAILEAIKTKMIIVLQHQFFGEIKICSYNEELLQKP